MLFLIRFGFLVVECLAKWWFWLANWSRPRGELPPVDDEVLLDSAVTLAKKIRRKQVTCERVVQACIRRTQQVGPLLNCVAATRFEAAVSEARKVDAFLASTRIGADDLARDMPFLGVPFTCKESLAVAGMEQSCGFLPRKGYIATEDSPVVKMMKDAGGILIATTNVPELAFWWETVSRQRGVTLNPYDFRRTPGGSSGGEAALVASAGSPIGIATDFYGSIRIPANFCGIFGHKPSGRIVPSGGHFPDGGEKVEGTFVVGPVARTAADCEAVMNVLSRPSTNKLVPMKKPLKNLKVFYMPHDCGGLLTSFVNDEVEDMLLTLVARLNCDGATAKKVRIPEAGWASLLFLFESIERGGRDSLRLRMNYPNKGPLNPFKELFWYVMGKSIHVWPLVLSALVEYFATALLRTPVRGLVFRRLASVRQKFRDLLDTDENTVFLYPTMPHTALFHGQPCVVPFNASYTALLSILQLPVTQVHLGMSSDGLPIGAQVVGGPGKDWLTLAVAEEIENKFGGWKPPFPVLHENTEIREKMM